MMEQHLPAVFTEMEDVGAIRYNAAEAQARRLPEGAGKNLDLSRFETMTTCRRPLIEYAYASAARKTPGVEVRYGCPVAGLVTGNEVIPGVPHITGVRTDSGETIDASVVVDAAGRRSPLSGMIQAAGGRQPPEHAFEAGFVYNTQYYLGASLPEQRDDLLSAVGSISVLTIPGDHGWWSVTLYHSPKDKLMRNVRDPKTFERVVRALPNHAHWADGAPQGNSFSMASTANTTREFVVDGVPCATGVVPVGDAWGFTNPSIGRGITLGLMHAVDLAPAIAEHMEDPRRLGAEWERRTDDAGRQVARLDGRLRPDPRSRGRSPTAGSAGSLRSRGPFGRRATGVRLGVAPRPGGAAMVLRGGRLLQPARRSDGPRRGVRAGHRRGSVDPAYTSPGPTRAELEELLV